MWLNRVARLLSIIKCWKDLPLSVFSSAVISLEQVITSRYGSIELGVNEMSGVLGHLCAHIGSTGPGEPPEDGEILS